MLGVEADGDDTLHNRILTDLNLVDIRHCLSGGDARGGWDATSYLHSSGPATVLLQARGATLYRGPRPSDPALSGSGGWTMPRRRPYALWLHKVEAHPRDMGMAGLASVWAMAR